MDLKDPKTRFRIDDITYIHFLRGYNYTHSYCVSSSNIYQIHLRLVIDKGMTV